MACTPGLVSALMQQYGIGQHQSWFLLAPIMQHALGTLDLSLYPVLPVVADLAMCPLLIGYSAIYDVQQERAHSGVTVPFYQARILPHTPLSFL